MDDIEAYFEELWDKHSSEIRNYIRLKVNNTYDVEDILQDVFIKVYQNIEKLEKKDSVKSWIFTITKNKIIDFYRKKKDLIISEEKLVELVGESYDENFETNNCNKEVHDYIKTLSKDIPKKYLEVYTLYEKEGMKHKDIVDKLGISISASKVRLMRAKELLKKNIKNDCGFKHDKYGNVIDCQSKIESIKCC